MIFHTVKVNERESPIDVRTTRRAPNAPVLKLLCRRASVWTGMKPFDSGVRLLNAFDEICPWLVVEPHDADVAVFSVETAVDRLVGILKPMEADHGRELREPGRE